MIRNITILAALLGLAVAYTWYDNHNRDIPRAQGTQAQALPDRQEAPDFVFTSLDGRKRSLSDFKGKAIVLNFWASWCAPCVIEFPQMLRLAKSLPDESVFLFVSLDEDAGAIERFLKTHAEEWPQQNVWVAQDPDKTISQSLYETYKLPETYLIAADLTIAEKIIGADVAWDSDIMRKKLRELAE